MVGLFVCVVLVRVVCVLFGCFGDAFDDLFDFLNFVWVDAWICCLFWLVQFWCLEVDCGVLISGCVCKPVVLICL